MKYQALLLALVILVSLAIGPARIRNMVRGEPKINEISGSVQPVQIAETQAQPEATNQAVSLSFYSFLDDLSSAAASAISSVGEKIFSAGRLISANLSGAVASNQASVINSSANVINSSAGDVSISKNNINPAPQQTFSCGFDSAKLDSQAVLVKNLQDFPSVSQTIFELNADRRWPIASVSKLMAAVIVQEKMDLNQEIILNDKDVAVEGDAGNFKIGEKFKLSDLMKAMLIVSSNDAAYAIAGHFQNGQQSFVNEMQKKAAELKMFSTSYLEPSGLSFVNQSTPNDLSKLMEYIYMKHSEILAITKQKTIQIKELNSGKSRSLSNIDNFAGDFDFVGGKTGYIDESGHNLMAIFNMNGTKILTVVLGAGDQFAETQKLKDFVKNCQ